MEKAEVEAEAIDEAKSTTMGIGATTNRELHSFLKDRCTGTAASVVRSNRSRLGLESWRMLNRQFNPRTLIGTLNAHQLETRPKGATKMSDLPGCLLEWEKKRTPSQ